MKLRAPTIRWMAVTWVLAASAGGCARTDESASSVATSGSQQGAAEAAPRIALPDVSQLAESVQAQVRELHSALMAKLDDPATPPAELADAYGELGLILMAVEYSETAASCYLAAQALVPGDARWPYYLGHLYRMEGDAADAEKSFARALQLKPSDPPTLIWLGETYLDEDRPDQAAPLFRQVLSRDPGSASALSGAGRAALAQHDFALAADYLERALKVDPQARRLHYALAAAYRGMGQVERATAHLEQRGNGWPAPHDPLMEAYEAVLRSPLNYETQGLRALEAGQVKEAADLFRKGLELAPEDPKLLHRLGTALYMQGDAAGAVQEFQHALRVAPDFPRAHFGLGMVNLSGRPAEAVEHFAAAVKYQPDYLEARIGLAQALLMSGRPQDALPQFARIVELDPSFAEAWVMYARTLVQLQRYGEARERLREAMRIHPDDPELNKLLAGLPAMAPDGRP